MSTYASRYLHITCPCPPKIRAGDLGPTGGLSHGTDRDLQVLGSKFEADQVTRGEQGIPIPFFVDVVSGHRPLAVPTCFISGGHRVPGTFVGGVLARTQLARQAGRARVTQPRPDNRLTALATARGRAAFSHSHSFACADAGGAAGGHAINSHRAHASGFQMAMRDGPDSTPSSRRACPRWAGTAPELPSRKSRRLR